MTKGHHHPKKRLKAAQFALNLAEAKHRNATKTLEAAKKEFAAAQASFTEAVTARRQAEQQEAEGRRLAEIEARRREAAAKRLNVFC